MQDARFQVLALDGGGFRGLFQAQCLAHWEEHTGKRTADCFDMISGTSTGGILALALALGIPAREIVEFYRNDGKRIFPTNQISRWARSLKRLALPKLDSGALRAALIARFGKRLLGDAQTRLLIPAFDLSVQRPFLFKTDHLAKYRFDWNRPAWEVAMATSSAPTYFRPYRSSWASIYIDGGVWANNPAHLAAIEAEVAVGAPRESIHILNLGNSTPCKGCGKLEFRYRLGIAGWAADVSELILDSAADAVAGEMRLTYGECFVRVAPAPMERQIALDLYQPDWILTLANEQARFHQSVAEVFFSHSAPPYAKCRRRSHNCETVGGAL
jgi:hypothetical protein